MNANYSTGSLTKGGLSPLDQIRLFEKKYDPGTTAILGKLPLRRGWACLELGAGAGSLARWLAKRVEPGRVLAVDIDTAYLHAEGAPNLTVQQADITSAQFEDRAFDLIVARAVFGHLREPEATLRRTMNWLAPGGWMLVEDTYYLPSEHAPTEAGRILIDGYLRLLLKQGANLAWGRNVPAALARAGLASIDCLLTAAGPGQSTADDDLIGLRLRQEGHRLVEQGVVTADQLTKFLENLGTPQGRDMTALMVSAWGRRPF